MNNEDLIRKALSLIHIKVINDDRRIGDVACVLLTDKGNMYGGVNIAGHVGICAEQTASGAMVTAGEYTISKIVAVRNENDVLYVIPPCGRCREFLTKINEDNLETEVILSHDTSVKLKELLTHHKAYKPIPNHLK